jgi:predicted ATPase
VRFHIVPQLGRNMGIQELKIRGYRSFRDAIWRPGRLNLLVGPNGGGKSNLLRLLQFLRESSAGRLRKAVKDAGGMGALRWNDEADDVAIELHTTFGGQKRNEYRWLLAVVGSGYEIDSESLRIWRVGAGAEKLLDAFDVDAPSIRFGEDAKWSIADDEAWDLAEPILAQLSPGSQHGAAVLFRRCLFGFTIFSEIGGIDLDAIRAPTTTQPTEKLESDGSNLVNVLHTLYSASRDFQNDVRLAMNTAFGDEYDELVFAPAAAQQIQLAVRWRSSARPHSARQLSDGTLRFLLWITALLTADRTTIVAIDEPEVGLHPSMLPILG